MVRSRVRTRGEGIALSSRLLRRLRLLQDATRSLDEDALDTLVARFGLTDFERGIVLLAGATLSIDGSASALSCASRADPD